MSELIDAARVHLPGWIGWVNVAVMAPAALVVTAVIARLSVVVLAAPHDKLKEGVHWSERARMLFPARRGMILVGLALPMAFGAVALMMVGPFSHLPPWLVGALVAVASLVGTLGAWASLTRRVLGRPVTRREAARRILERTGFSFVLMVPHLTVGGVVAAATPGNLGVWSFVWFMGGLAVLIAMLKGGNIALARAVRLVRPAPAGSVLMAAVETAAVRTGVRPKQTLVLNLGYANALALPFSGHLIFTREILGKLEEAELAAVCAHEMGHLSEPMKVLLSRAVPIVAFYAMLAFIKPLYLTYDLLGVGCAVVGFLLAVVLTRNLSRRMEERADEVGEAHEGEPGTYARALEKIYEINLMPAAMKSKRRAHPDLYDRIQGAGVEPDFPRPEPPPQGRRRIFSVAMILLIFGVVFFGLLGATFFGSLLPEPHNHHFRIAFSSDCGWEMSELALSASEARSWETSATLYGAAQAIDLSSPYAPLNRALTLVYLEKCEAALEAFTEGEERAALWPYPDEIKLLLEATRGAAQGCQGAK